VEEQKDEMEHAKITNRIVAVEKYRKVLRLELELNREIKEEDKVMPGSYITITPKNDSEIVKQFITLCKWEESEELVFKLTNEVDFLKSVNKNALKLLVDSKEDLYLKETGTFNYFDIVNFLKPSSPVNIQILEYIPTMKPRYYSLATDLVDTNRFEI